MTLKAVQDGLLGSQPRPSSRSSARQTQMVCFPASASIPKPGVHGKKRDNPVIIPTKCNLRGPNEILWQSSRRRGKRRNRNTKRTLRNRAKDTAGMARERTNPVAERTNTRSRGKDKVNVTNLNHLSKVINLADHGKRIRPALLVITADMCMLTPNRKQGGSPLLRLLSPALAFAR